MFELLFCFVLVSILSVSKKVFCFFFTINPPSWKITKYLPSQRHICIKQNLMSFNLEGPSNLARLKVVSSLWKGMRPLLRSLKTFSKAQCQLGLEKRWIRGFNWIAEGIMFRSTSNMPEKFPLFYREWRANNFWHWWPIFGWRVQTKPNQAS